MFQVKIEDNANLIVNTDLVSLSFSTKREGTILPKIPDRVLKP